MATFRIAHVKEQGVDLIIVEVDQSFPLKTPAEQQDITFSLQSCATAAGLDGTVVPVWKDGPRLGFHAPPNWRDFFRSLTTKWFVAHANRELIYK